MIRDRLCKLREVMQREEMDYYLIPTADYHASEYVSDYFQVREYFSGFTGSNGTLLVWKDGAGLWTDGRYFIQAEQELAGTGITLFRMQMAGVPTISEYLSAHMTEGQVLGFDGKVIPAKTGLQYEKLLSENKITITDTKDLAFEVWQNRPSLPCGLVQVLPLEISGKAASEKMKDVRAYMAKNKADSFFLSKLDDIMWLLNIRGCDVTCNPVALSYLLITQKEAYLFIQEAALTTQGRAYFAENHITLFDYQMAEKKLPTLVKEGVCCVDSRYVSFAHYRLISHNGNVVFTDNCTESMKAIKNETELKNMEAFYLKDSVAVTKLIYWLKNNIGKAELTELDVAKHMDDLRREITGFCDLSFPTISAYGANAAMMHYEATKEKHAVLAPKGMLLLDSGGQYEGATTDVTRTIVLGELTAEEKKHYTLTAKGMLALLNAHFIEGCTGRNLDILAREPLWKIDIDYLCGTGHGVGYFLNVHEGPHGIRWKYNPDNKETILKEGMVVTDEPGVYIEGSHGIRIENVLVVKKGAQNLYGQFLHFDTLTYVPLDPNAIDESLLDDKTKEDISNYQKLVYEKIAAYLEPNERAWLKKETQ